MGIHFHDFCKSTQYIPNTMEHWMKKYNLKKSILYVTERHRQAQLEEWNSKATKVTCEKYKVDFFYSSNIFLSLEDTSNGSSYSSWRSLCSCSLLFYFPAWTNLVNSNSFSLCCCMDTEQREFIHSFTSCTWITHWNH